MGPDLELCDTPTTNPHYILGDILIPRTSNFKRGDNVKLIVAYMDIGEPSCCMVAIGWIDPNGSRLRQVGFRLSFKVFLWGVRLHIPCLIRFEC